MKEVEEGCGEGTGGVLSTGRGRYGEGVIFFYTFSQWSYEFDVSLKLENCKDLNMFVITLCYSCKENGDVCTATKIEKD